MADRDVLVIGGGPGGYVAAIRAAQLGLTTSLIDDGPALGGTCLNVGCIPSKALLESSELYWAARNQFSDHGIEVSPELRLDAMMSRKERIVRELTGGVGLLMKKNDIEVIQGRGRLLGQGRVRVTDRDGAERELTSRHVILAMGSVPVALPELPFDEQLILSSTGALELERVPQHLVVVGGGAIGLELGSVWARVGSKVTVVELLDSIVPFADRRLARRLQKALESRGLEFQLGTRVTGAERTEHGLRVTIEDRDGEQQSMTCDRILVAVGRRPATAGQGLEDVGISLDDRGFVIVDEAGQTSVSDVWAIGDLVSGPMLAHRASEEGVAVAERIAGQPGFVDHTIIPNVVYTSPELAMVGRTEEQLKEEGVPYRAGRFSFRANGRAKSLGEEEGMVTILAHAETDRILGVHMLGPRVSELIAEAVVAMSFAGSAEDLARIVHAHPTLSEVVHESALAVDKRQING